MEYFLFEIDAGRTDSLGCEMELLLLRVPDCIAAGHRAAVADSTAAADRSPGLAYFELKFIIL